MAKPKIEGLELTSFSPWHTQKPAAQGYRFAIGWNDGEDRFHFWACSYDRPEIAAFSPDGPLYKNPCNEKSKRGEGYQTRQLDPASKTWAPIIAQAIAKVAELELFDQRLRAWEAHQREEGEKLEAAKRERQIEVAGKSSYELLRRLVDALDPNNSPGILDEALAQARLHLEALEA